MKKFYKLIILIAAALIFFKSYKSTFAVTNPHSTENNIFGIHIQDENDLIDAAKLVNSSGGEWGYVTMVLRSDERDVNRWQNVFDRMRELHLIPIIRIATKQEGSGWLKPTTDDIDGWVNFLDSLNWVTQNRYVVVGNEPNHAAEWGGVIDPQGYAEFLKEFSIQLKRKDDDFFVLPAGLDASSPNNKTHMSETNFIKSMHDKVPDIFDHIDGWTSHSYPNPNFSESPDKTGIVSITGYINEIEFIKTLSVKKNLPIFITETGWTHDVGGENKFLSVDVLKKYYTQAFEKWLKDPNIVAVTPFMLNYQSEPFNTFSFKKADGSFYDFYSEIQKMLKKSGNPKRINSATMVAELTPDLIQKDDKTYQLSILKNTGQMIWEMDNLYIVKIEGYDIDAEIGYPLFTRIDPGHIGILMFRKL
ncbi:MAG TPA: hypothetical protein VI819_01200 [Patescibacteria group bacterium]|nr:hypothetical protein [Patescibacteria group bacterium]